MFHASRYGNTEVRRERKAQAVEELRQRGLEALDYLVTHSHLKNIWFRIYAQQLVEQLSAGEAVPVLLRYVDSSEKDVRKNAVYFLGFYDAPEHAAKIMTLLDDEELAGVAIRTLGKWKVSSASMRIVPFLEDDEERRRIMAANALREIGDPRTVPALIEALDDEFFTVRRTAGRALESMSNEAEPALLRATRSLPPVGIREVIRVLKPHASRRSRRTVEQLLDHEDPGVRNDAADFFAATDEQERTGAGLLED